ncbi:DUF937 domain-containing protein [Occultella glacieicola]|uniref:DUF937 domain-containing protein n=1 Tax=Occultella glacieicola TaxID=2518684 RepID=A0ABY2E2F4_9MICO|nr:DUF937 domain-containing protein [Occultella glacieicola]TDE88857.1 DUF937 domain-containing protein [Occultella glacieicola]
MSTTEEILDAVPMDQVAARLGVDRATAERATRAALPTLLAGMNANAADPAGARSLAGAISHHDPGLVEGGVDLDQVDTDDGAKIVRNVFGQNTDAVVNTLAKADSGSDGAGSAGAGGLGDLLPKLLPILAPIVLSFLAKKFGQGGGAAGEAGSGGLGDLLGGLLGGAAGGAAGSGGAAGGAAGSGGDLGDILGGWLGGSGGGSGAESGGGLGDLLGGLLGGGKR